MELSCSYCSSTPFIAEGDQVLQELWYSATDFDEFKRVARLFATTFVELQIRSNIPKPVKIDESGGVAALESSTQQTESTTDTLRGLEHMMNSMEDKRDRFMRKKECIRCVLMTQDRLRMELRIDADSKRRVLARVSMQYSQWARRLALQMGTMDAQAVTLNASKAFE